MSTRYVVGFSRKRHFFARSIMWFTKSEVSHCYIRQIGEGTDYVLEANHRGVNLQWHDVFKREGAIVVAEFEVHYPSNQLDEAWAGVCYDRLNLPYGWGTIVGDAYVYFRYWLTRKRVKNPFGAPWQDVCSELVLAWILKAEIPGFDDLDRVFVAPSDPNIESPGLLEVTLKYPEVFRALEDREQSC